MTDPSPTTTERAATAFGLIWGVMWRLALVAVVVCFLIRIRFVLVTVLLAAILAFVMNPFVDKICQCRGRSRRSRPFRGLVSLAALIALAGLLALLIWVLYTPLVTEMQRLSQNFPDYEKSVRGWVDSVKQGYGSLSLGSQEAVSERLDSLTKAALDYAQRLVLGAIKMLSHVVELFVIPILAFYFAWDHRAIKREMMFLVPRARVRDAVRVLRETGTVMQTYIIAQITLALIAGVVVTIALKAAGMPYWLVLGILAGLTRAIPIIGPIFGGVVIVGLAIILRGGWYGLAIFLIYGGIHLLESKFLLPMLIGHRIKLHPATVLVVLLIGGEFLGLLGMFLAPPVAAIGRDLVGIFGVRRRGEAA
jgi:predicted PurR-regulated permease PerM